MYACQSPDGVFDLSGNVAEWDNCCDAFSGKWDLCRLRGGSYDASEFLLTCADDDSALREASPEYVGFRCCSD